MGAEDRSARFGIVLATCRRPTLLVAAVQSVLAQTHREWRLVVIDDSGERDARDALRQALTDPRITLLENEANRGVGYSRNRGLDFLHDQTDFTHFVKLDDDDQFVANALTAASRTIRVSPTADWLISRHFDAATGSSVTQILETNAALNYWSDILCGDTVQGDAVHFISRSLLERSHARYPEDVPLGGEWRFYAELARLSDVYPFEGGNTIGTYLPGGLSSHYRDDPAFAGSELADMAELGKSLPLTAAQSAAAVETLDVRMAIQIIRYARVGRFREGFALLWPHIGWRGLRDEQVRAALSRALVTSGRTGLRSTASACSRFLDHRTSTEARDSSSPSRRTRS